jgi:hypothetical protein
MSAEGKKYAVAVVCADGRLHQDEVHFNKALKEHLGVDLVDVLAVAGPDGVMKPGREGEAEALAKNLQVLIGAHHPVSIAFVGHYNCAGNPVEDAQHDKDVQDLMARMDEMLSFDGDLVSMMATYKSDTEWPLKEVAKA